jgi:GDP-4-dehydro-6-deoxy-D-mannose reductase
MRIFITGLSGFIGSHLASLLSGEGHEVWGTYYIKAELSALDAVKHRVKALHCDIRDRRALRSALAKARPERVYHLAAQSFPTVSWAYPAMTMDTNALGTINLFEALRGLRQRSRVLVAGSSAIYGFVTPEEVPVSEDHPMRPLHPYGVSKVAQEMLAYQYFKNFGTWASTARIFNTTGPGKVHDVCADFASQVARIEAGGQKNPMRVGNLSPRRDITDVRDQVMGLEAIIENGEPGEAYNLCSSRAVSIQDVLDRLVALSTARIEVRVDKKLFRPTDEPVIMGDNAKVVKATGWMPKIPISTTLKDTLDFWRRRFSR